MNPDKLLKQLRESLRQKPCNNPDVAAAMAGQFAALDSWLSNGGEPPKAWKR